jgi:hypothetical protein
LESDRGDPFFSIIPVNEKAGDPPGRQPVETIKIGSFILDARKLVSRPELTPANGSGTVIHQSCVSLAFSNSLFLVHPILQRGPVTKAVLQVKSHAPTAAPNTVVLLYQPSKIWPSCFIQRLDLETGHHPL